MHCKVRVTATGGRVVIEGIGGDMEQSRACNDIASRVKGVNLPAHLFR